MNFLFPLFITASMFFSRLNGGWEKIFFIPSERTYLISNLSNDSSYSADITVMPGGIDYGNIHFAVKKISFFAFYLNSGKMTQTDEAGNITGSFSYSALILSGLYNVGEYNGININILPSLYLETGGGWSNLGAGMNIGARKQLSKKFLAGANIRNIGYSSNPRELTDFDGGALLQFKSNGFITLSEIQYQKDVGVGFNQGIKLSPAKLLDLFFSYTTNYRVYNTGSGSDIIKGLSIGIGFNKKPVNIRYGVSLFGEFGILHVVYFRYSL